MLYFAFKQQLRLVTCLYATSTPILNINIMP